MADNTIAITAGTGTSVRTVTNAGVDGGAHQQIVGLADAAGNLLGTTGAPLPVSQATSIPAGTNSIGSVVNAAGTAYMGQVRLTDGTNSATVKPASTAVAAADTAAVVGLHPSSPLPAGGNAIGQLTPSTTVVTATAAAATAVTATLAAPAAGLSHYITNVRYTRFMTAAGTGAGTSVVTGGSNHAFVEQLPTDAAAIGTQSVPVDYRPTTPLKVTAAATATTFTAPAVAGTIYRITVTYYTAA